jgi:hypothetical protein
MNKKGLMILDWALMMSSLCTMLTATNSSLNMWIYLNKVDEYLTMVDT